jgi:hypothetical protein
VHCDDCRTQEAPAAKQVRTSSRFEFEEPTTPGPPAAVVGSKQGGVEVEPLVSDPGPPAAVVEPNGAQDPT